MEVKLIEEALAEQKEEFALKLKTDFCKRREESLVDLNSSLAQVVIGVRRSGKSTMCTNILKSGGILFGYVNFDDERLSNLKAEDLNLVLETLYKIYGDFNHLFIDEIQNISEWYLFVNRLIRKGMHILITGSNAKLLSGELATHLTGRHMQTELFPFSFAEYCACKKINTNSTTTKDRAFLRATFDDYLKEGGFPELLIEKRKQTYINSLVRNILKNDIEKRYSIKYKAAFEQLADHLLNNVPCAINYAELQNTFKLKSAHTAENYVQYLKNAYLIQGLHKYSNKSKIRVRAEKAYPVDVALMNNRENAFAGENLGWRLESIVYIELLRRYKPLEYDVYYYDENRSECDFILCKGKSVECLIQVSYDIANSKTLRRELNGLENASKATGCKKLFLLTYADEQQIEQNGLQIEVLPVWKWCVN